MMNLIFNMNNVLALITWFLVVGSMAWLIKSSIVYVPNDKVGILEKLWTFKGSVKDGLIPLNGEAGYQPDMLRGGIHFLVPFMYRVHKNDLVLVPQGQIGYVFARDGQSLPSGQALGDNTKASSFNDVRAFLANGGQKGPQRKILREGTHAINMAQFVVLTQSNIYDEGLSKDDEQAISAMHKAITNRNGFYPIVIDGAEDNIGVVTIHDGPSLSSGELIAPVVGQVDGVSTHNNFQEPDLFLSAKGFRGRQQQVLVDGTYYINCLFATVEFIKKTVISIGQVGVVVSYTGSKGVDISGEDYQHGELVESSSRGVSKDPLLPGKYPFNKFSGNISMVPTINFILKWEANASGSEFDQNLKEVSLITKDAFEPLLPLSVVVHIDYRRAPRVIQRFGDIKMLVEQTLDPMVSAYFKNIGQTKTLIELLQNRSEIQKAASVEMKEKFALYDLELQEVLIGTPRSNPGDHQIETILNQLRDRQVAREKAATYIEQEKAANQEKTLREAEAVAAQQKGLTESKISIEIAKNAGDAKVQTLTKDGEGQAAKIRTIAEAEAKRIEVTGEATANAAEKQVRAFGGPEARLAQEVAAMFTNAIKEGNIQMVPQVVVGGDGKGVTATDAMMGMIISTLQSGKGLADLATSLKKVPAKAVEVKPVPEEKVKV